MSATRIAHLTDLHFGATDPAVVAGLHAELHADPPDLVVVSGDLTMGARSREFREARAFLDDLRAPTLCVPGNHDISPYRLAERFLMPYARWRREMGAGTEPLWRNSEVAVIGLNTARRASAHLDWSRGRVSDHRLRRLIARLDALPKNLTRIVVGHHPLLAPSDAATHPQVAGNASRALAEFAAHGVRMVLAGHLHRAYFRLAAPTGPSPLVVQGGSATSTRLRGEPNAYNRITIEKDGSAHIEGRIWNGVAWITDKAHAIRLDAPLHAQPGSRRCRCRARARPAATRVAQLLWSMENRAQYLYWTELVELKVACEYVRRYRDDLNAILTRFAVARSVVSVGALGGWVTTHVNPQIWASAIVLVQVAEALQRAIPYASSAAGTNDLCAAFDALFIDCLMEWEEIAAGRMEEEQITKRWGRMMTLRLAADRKALPHGLPRRPRLLKLATEDARAYFQNTYPTEEM